MAKKPFKRRAGGDSEALRRMFQDNEVEQIATFPATPATAPSTNPVTEPSPVAKIETAETSEASATAPAAASKRADKSAPEPKAKSAPRRSTHVPPPNPAPAAKTEIHKIKFTFAISDESARDWVEDYVALYGPDRLIRSVACQSRQKLRDELTRRRLSTKRAPEERAKRHLSYETTMNLNAGDLAYLTSEYDPIGIMTEREIVSAAMTDAAHAVIATMQRAARKRA